MWQDTIDWIVRNRISIGFVLIVLFIGAFNRFSSYEPLDWVPENSKGKVTGYRHEVKSSTRRRSYGRKYIVAEFQINDDTVLYEVRPKDSTGFGMGDSIYRIGDTLFYVDSADWFRERKVLRLYR